MTSIIVAVLVVTLMLPGLAMLVAIVVRYVLRGAPRPPEPGDDEGPAGPAA
jgi:hypothetical protein